MQNKVLIANRGEIAIRIIRACKELGIGQVAVYSKADADSLHVKLADEAICIGEAKSADSYLNMTNLISAAIATGCNAIHPGYGFLAENEKFAEMVEKCNIKFIGPSSEVIHKLGNKIEAKRLAREANIPVVEGSDGVVETLDEAIKVAQRVTYPILIKARNGGGGKGISIIRNENELVKMFELTRQEAKANFGDAGVYIEKYIENPHHIEVQIIGDSFGNIIHLGERDCSVQRRNQKVIEESPSPFVDDELRAKLGDAAIRLAKNVGYVNAGTVEFLVDKNKNFYFIEMNTRIQVEHPVTEWITGIDLIKEQISVAAGVPLSFTQDDVEIKGWAIECRVNAENPAKNFMPSPGKINRYLPPGGFGVRVDSACYQGYEISPFYDSMIAKIIVWGKDRQDAIDRMKRALSETIIEGPFTTIPFHQKLLEHEKFLSGNFNTKFLEENKIEID